jgi:hypothetical protein
MEIKLSLHKANKLRKSMINEFRRLRYPSGYIEINISNRDLKEELISDMNKTLDKQNENDKLILDFLNVEVALKKALFKANVESGVHDILEDISLIKNKIKLSEQIISGRNQTMFNKEEVDFEKQLELVSNTEDRYNSSKIIRIKTSVEPFDVKSLKKELRQLEDRQNELNVTTKITIDIPESLQEIFGF